MSVWKFTTAAGEAYELQGPPGATYDQAQAVFNKQVNSGGLVGLPVGGLVNAVTQSIDGLATAPAYIGPQAVSVAKQVGNYLVLPTPIGTLPTTSITTSDFVNTKTIAQTIGTVTSPQVQGLVATVAASVKQSSNVITNIKGLGTYGLTADQLQTAGLIKPGIADQVRQDPANAVSILSSPISWTGKQGATDINAILNDAGLQTSTQQDLMTNSFNQLKQVGTINGTEAASTVGPLVNAATVYGVANATSWLNNNAPAAIVGGVSGLIASSGFGGAFGTINQSLSGGGTALSSGTVAAKGYTNTVDRANVNRAMKAIIGNPKIPTPYFQSAGTSTSNPAAATNAVQAAISTLTSSGLSAAQIVDVINGRSGGATVSTYGGILRAADGTPITDKSGSPISIGGDSPTLGSGITAADKAAMFSGAASAATGTSNDGVPSSSTNTSTGTAGGFTSAFNNTAAQKAIVGSILSGTPGALVSLGTTAVVSGVVASAATPTQSATPGVSNSVSASIAGAVNALKAAAVANPQGVQAALSVASIAGAAFGPLGSIVAKVLTATLTPTITQALAEQAQINSLINAPVLDTSQLVAFSDAELASNESKSENNPVPSSEQKSLDAAAFGGNDPPSNDNGGYSNSLSNSPGDSSGGGGP